MTAHATAVVGGSGLLGAAVRRELARRGAPAAHPRITWSDPDRAVEELTAAAAGLLAAGRPWRLFWCAGAGVVATDPGRLEVEVRTVERFLGRLEGLVADAGTPGAVFLASSAGGVYAGSAGAPFTEETEPRAISPYGEAKLATEEALRRFAGASGVPVLVGRIANLYGPGQDPAKAQGLISVLCRAHLARRPSSIYVSLDTSRDYLFADDAARLAVAGTERVATLDPGSVVVKVLASQTGTTVAAILGELRRITKHRPRVVLGTSPSARFQVRDLRLRSVVWPDLDGLVTTSLPTGMAATMQSALAEHAAGHA